MSPTPLIWINKTAKSQSLSNSRANNEQRAINKHVQTLTAQKLHTQPPSSRLRNSMLNWRKRSQGAAKKRSTCTSPSTKQDAEQPECSDSRIWLRTSQPRTCSQHSLNLEDYDEILWNLLKLRVHGGHLDPFSSFEVNLDTNTLRHLRYFDIVWSRIAFQSPASKESGPDPIEISAIVQNCLADELSHSCLLAAVARRMQVVHGVQYGSFQKDSPERHAAQAMQLLRQRLQNKFRVTEQLALNILFLSAFELYRDNYTGCREHIKALQLLQKDDFQSRYAQSLYRNIDLFVATASLAPPILKTNLEQETSIALSDFSISPDLSFTNTSTGAAFFSHGHIFDPETLRIIQNIIQCAHMAEDRHQHSTDSMAYTSRLVTQLIAWSEELSHQLVSRLTQSQNSQLKRKHQSMFKGSIIVLLMWLSYLPVGIRNACLENPHQPEDNLKMVQGRGSALVRTLKEPEMLKIRCNAHESELFLWILAGGIVMSVDADDVEYCALAFAQVAEKLAITTYTQLSNVLGGYLWLDKFEVVDYEVLAGLLDPARRVETLIKVTELAYKVQGEKRRATRVTDRLSNRHRMGG